jgi:SSS family solute:Na+ symporter
MGRATFPGLPASQSESIFPMLLARYASPAVATLLLTGGLAALMSTMDSQLLTVSSLVSMDFLPRRGRGVAGQRLAVLAIGVLGYLVALRPPQTILDFVNRSSFTGLAALAPAVLGGLYWKKANARGAAASILVGEALVALFYFNVVRLPGIQPVVPVVAAAAAALALVSLAFPSRGGNPQLAVPPRTGRAWHAAPFAILFILANDFWAWGRAPVVLLGLPLWVWYSIVLGFALALAYALVLRTGEAALPGVKRG